ncbi:hypothetical protein [Campylobacter pinnipediorum]|nr:hypothetical protein [Campylobacter pinnipediorum]
MPTPMHICCITLSMINNEPAKFSYLIMTNALLEVNSIDHKIHIK